MKIYVTKYACSEAIRLVEVAEDLSATRLRYRWKWYLQTAEKGEWFLTEAEALADAERRRDARLAALHRQIEKLEKRVFKIKECENVEA